MNSSIWRPAANKFLNDASLGDGYELVRSFWVQIFETWNNCWTMRRLHNAADTVERRLLEIGVGSGSFLAYGKAQSYSLIGCDLSAAICRRVEGDTGVTMHCGSRESLPDAQPFDVVVMNHVLEHRSESVTLLKAMRTRLEPGGVLHLVVPNVGAWEAQLPGWNCYKP